MLATRRFRPMFAMAAALVLALTQVAVVILPTASAQAASFEGPWGSANHGYRLPIEITPAADGSALYVPVAVDFTAAFAAAGVSGLRIDPGSLLVQEVNSNGVSLSPTTSFQFDPGPTFDPIDAAVGDLVIEVAAPTTRAQTRNYLVYFDALGSAASGAVVTDQVIVTTGLFDEGLPAISIDTPTADWWYQDQAGGFSSLLDPVGADWISWSTQTGSSGEFRGIPNLVFPAGFFHPGSTGHTTAVDIDGPVHARLTTLSPDGLWEMQWDLYPSHAEATVLAADSPYWFLYEGTPGGAVDKTSDFWADSSGSTATLNTPFNDDIADPEWVQFGDPVADRSLFAAHDTAGVETDSYRTLDSAMTVFGFGRTGLTRLLTGVDRHFSVGLLDTADQTAAADAIEAVRSLPGVVVGPGQSQATDVTAPVIVVGPETSATSDTIDITWTTDEASTSEVSFGLTSALELGTVTTPGYVFDHLVSLSGLSCETEFHTAVTTLDSSGNSTTSPTTTTDTTACEYPLDISVVGSGSVTRSPDQATYLPGVTVQLTADPNGGEAFIGWSGDATGFTQTIDVIMPAAPVSITGTFSEPTGPVPVVRYGFGEGSGVVVGDSGSGAALDLVIDDPAQAVWVAGGLELSGAAVVSSGPASKVFEAVDVSGEMTIEAWVDPADASQGGPARIVSSASGPKARNFMLGQGAYGSLPDDVFASRVRTSSSVGGTPTMFTPPGSARPGLTHVVLTRDSAGLQTLYVDGVAATTSTVSGDVSNWDPSFPLSIGNISTGDRPWNGTLCLVAVYDVVLTAAETATNHGAGCSQANVAPVIAPPVGDQSSGEGQTISLQVSAADSNGDALLYSATGLPAGLAINANTGLISGTVAAGEAAKSPLAATITVDDQNGETVTEDLTWTVTVNTSPTFVAAVGDQTAAEGDTISVQVSASDADSDPLTYSATGLPADLTINPVTGLITGTLSQTSATTSPRPVTITVDDSNGGTDTEYLTWTITPTNVAPVAADDSYTTLLDVPLAKDVALGVLANDVDADNDPLQALLVDDVTDGLLALGADGSFNYTPDAGFAGADGFTYRTTDGSNQSSLASVSIQVTSTNEPLEIVTGRVGWEKQIIDDTALATHIALGADLDGDGDNDVVSTSLTNDQVRWYENDGAGGFISGIIDANLDDAYPAHVDDVDLDGDIDVLAAGYLADTFVWYENDGTATFTRHVVDGSSDGAHSIVTVDMDDDGDMDLVTSSQDADRIAWYENDGSENFTLRILDAASDGAKWAEPADVDNDGDIDVLAISFFDDQVSWYENDGSESFTKRVIDSTADGGYFLAPADIDADGDLDLFTASQRDNTIAWHENDGSENFTKRVIDGGAMAARSVIAADVDGDGDADAIAATVGDDTVAWYENDGSGSFVAHPVDFGADGAYGVSALDFDLDGDIEILGASRDDATVALYRQIRTHSAAVLQGAALTIDSSLLMTVDDGGGPSNIVYTVTDAPEFGTLSISGAALSGGSTFTQADVDQDLVVYTHGGIGNALDVFLFSVTAASGSRGSATGSFEIGITDPAALLVHLELDEGSDTNATDSSINGNNGTLTAGASFEANTADGSPSAVRLDGIDDTIALPNIDVGANGLTLALWMNPDTFSFGDARLISKATGTAANDHIFMLGTIKVGDEHLLRGRVRIGGVTTTVIASNGLLLPGSWRHAALTHDGSFARLYLDGVEVGRALAGGSVDTDPAIPVAVGAQPPGAGGRYFDGLVDDVRLLERAMSSAEIAMIAGGATP